MRASSVSHANTGVSYVWGQPCIQGCIMDKASDMFMEKKHCSSCLFSTACTNRAGLNCTLLYLSKERKGPIARTIKPFYEVFYWLIWRSCATCTVWPVWLVAVVGLPHSSLSLSLSPSLLTCRSSREVLQWGSLHHSVGISHHKHLVEHCVVVDEALDDTGRLHVIQVLFTEDNGHLMTEHTVKWHTYSSVVKVTQWMWWYEDYLFSLTGVLISVLIWFHCLDLKDNPVTGQVLTFTQSKLWRVWLTSGPVASYLVGVGSMSHPCFANWGSDRGWEKQRS